MNGAAKLASAAKSLPVLRWHARQWQIPTPRGSPFTSIRSARDNRSPFAMTWSYLEETAETKS
jgi:hypothetical protein